MPRLELYLLGTPLIKLDSVPIQVDTRKAIALMAYLAVTGERHRRDALAALLWPDADQSRARAALRRTLSTVNKALAGFGLRVDRETIGLDWNADLWIDLVQFRSQKAESVTHHHSPADVCVMSLGPLRDVVKLYRGEFLAGFTLRDSAPFDDWQFAESVRLRDELAVVLERLVICHTLQRDFQSARSHAQRWLDLDPLNEEAHRQLMRLYTRANQRTSALRQYRECVRILDRELGVQPLEATTELYQAVRENRPLPVLDTSQSSPPWPEIGPDASAADGEAPARVSTPGYPLVGRSTEWETLLETYTSIRADGHLIVVEGEAGIGKSRLAEEFLAHVRARGAATLAARCYQGEANLAYDAFVEGLRGAIARLGDTAGWWRGLPENSLAEAARLLPELSMLSEELPPPLPLDSPGAQSRFFESLAGILLHVCRGPIPGVLFLDDLQWADETSIDLLRYLVRRLRGRPICILITWRSEELEAEHPLRLLLAEAHRTGVATALSLRRLSLAEVAELVRAVSVDRIPLPHGIEERLHRETEGLPFFLVEYLATLTGRESPADGGWPVPASVRDLLRSRLASLSGASRQLLDTAAVIGRSFDFDTVQEASGRGEDEAVAALEALLAKGLVNEMRGAEGAESLSYDFSHERLRALTYEETSLARRRLLHRRVAEVLASHSRDRRQTSSAAGIIAKHYRTAAQDSKAAEYFILAGDHARALFANAEALVNYRSALVLGHIDEVGLHEAIGDLETLRGDYSAAITAYENAAALCDPRSIAGAERRLGKVHLRSGNWRIAESHFQAALTAIGDEGPSEQRSRIYADRSLAVHRNGNPGLALELARQAVELAEVTDDIEAQAQAHNVLGILSRNQGELDKACYHLEPSLALAETLSDPSARVAALNNLALARGATGDIEPAIKLVETALSLCASQGDRHREAAIHNNLADLLHASGESEAAMSQLKYAVTIFREIGGDPETLQPEIWKLVEW